MIARYLRFMEDLSNTIDLIQHIMTQYDFYCMRTSGSSNFIFNKYMKTSIYNTITLMITAMFTCTLLVATRKKARLIELAAQQRMQMRLVTPPGL